MTTATRKPTISTAAYERAHGRKPRGTGAWWYAAICPNSGDTLASVPVTGPYSRAVVIARHQLAALVDDREFDIEVLS